MNEPEWNEPKVKISKYSTYLSKFMQPHTTLIHSLLFTFLITIGS